MLQFMMPSLAGEDIDLARYQGHVLLIVNVASACGYTRSTRAYKHCTQVFVDANGRHRHAVQVEIVVAPESRRGDRRCDSSRSSLPDWSNSVISRNSRTCRT